MTKIAAFTFGLFAVAIAAQAIAALIGIEGVGQVTAGAAAGLAYLHATIG